MGSASTGRGGGGGGGGGLQVLLHEVEGAELHTTADVLGEDVWHLKQLERLHALVTHANPHFQAAATGQCNWSHDSHVIVI